MNNWISVKEKMPGYLTKCLVSNGEYVRCAWSKDEDDAWCVIDSYSEHDEWLVDVTHWMPLPAPPSLTPSNEPGK